MTHLSPEWRDKLINAGFPVEELNLGVAEEILRRLPWQLFNIPNANKDGTLGCLNWKTEPLIWEVGYLAGEQWVYSKSLGSVCRGADTLANAAAAMYVYLSENKLLPSP